MGMILGLVVTLGVFIVLMALVRRPPPVEIESDLLSDGFSKKESRKELRAQRREEREYARYVQQSARTAQHLGKGVGRLMKKSRRY